MLIVTKNRELNFKQFPELSVEIKYLQYELSEWSNFISVFKLFLDSNQDALLIDLSQNKSIDSSVAGLKTVEYFDCFDASKNTFSLGRNWIKLTHGIKLQIFSLSCRMRFILGVGFLSTRIAKTAFRAKAIQGIANSIGASKGVRVNFISKNPTSLIFSRRAASYLVHFNKSNTIDVDSVFQSILRSSNLSFGSLL